MRQLIHGHSGVATLEEYAEEFPRVKDGLLIIPKGRYEHSLGNSTFLVVPGNIIDHLIVGGGGGGCSGGDYVYKYANRTRIYGV